MIEIDIPGNTVLRCEHLVLDFNGTLACDGRMLPGLGARLSDLARDVQVHVLTADTFGDVRTQLADLPCRLHVLEPGRQDAAKASYVRSLGANRTMAIGNGRNDCRMLALAALGIAVILTEGAAVQTLVAADIVCTSILDALDLLRNPLRLAATLRV